MRPWITDPADFLPMDYDWNVEAEDDAPAEEIPCEQDWEDAE